MRSLEGLALMLFVLWPAEGDLRAAQPETSPWPGEREVAVGLYLNDLRKIDDIEQTVAMDFAFRARWQDEALRHDQPLPKILSLDAAWSPGMQLVSEIDLARKRPEVLEVAADGTVTYRQRFTGTLSAPMNFRDFPFDHHRLRLEFVFPSYAPDQLDLVIDEDMNRRAPSFSIANWEVGSGSLRVVPIQLLAEPFAGLVYEIDVRRKLGFYIWNVILPLMLVVLMSWTVFWIDPSLVASQISVAITANLTLIAYRFSIGFMVPRLPYLTRLDRMMVVASVVVFAALCEVIYTSRLANAGAEERARAVDRVARWVFPIATVTMLVVALWL